MICPQQMIGPCRGIISRLKPMEEPESVRHRIVEGVAIWAEMLNWMNKFENVDMIGRDEQNKIKSDYALDLAKEILDAKIYLDGTVAAAEIAKEAESLATQALGEAEKASLGANLAAEQLQKSKTAELEATTILESFSSDPLARELLKNKASQIIAQRLNEAVKALKEVQDAADVAQRAARQAKSASESTQQAAVNASKLAQAKEEAEVAALAAKQASARATLASEKAVMAYESAVQIVNAIDVGGKKVDVSAKDDLVSPMSKSNQESRAQFGSDGIPSQPPSSTPVDVVQQSLTIDPKIADSVFKHWKEIESQYLTSVKDVLRMLRMERWKSCTLLKQVKEEFVIFLKREDPKQQIFDDFQGKYNRVEPLQRRNTKMKAKLQAATEELGIKLRSFCDSNLKEAQDKCTKELEEWLKQSKLKLVAVFTSFIQIELQRFLETCNFLHEYIYAPASSSVNVFKTCLDAPKAAGPPPKTFPFPGWLSSIMASSPDLHQVLAQALYTSDNLSKSMDEQTNIEKSSKSALKKTKPLSRSTKDNVTNDLQVVDQKVKAISDADILATKGSAKLQAISREFDLLPAHLQLIARKGCAYIYELQLLKGNAYKQMDGWMQKLFQVPLENFHSEVCRMIDWRIFLISLLDVHFNNCISSSTVEEISRACIVMEDFSKESKGCITMQNFLDTSFWFELGSLRRSLDVGYNVKKLVLKVVKGDEELIPWKQLLLYLCRDEILEAALMKVFRVLCGTSPTSLELRVEELLQAAYPSGMEGARAAGCMSWTNEGIKQMIKNVIKERTFLLQEGGARGSRSSLTNKINSNNAGSTLAQKGSQPSEGTTYAIVDSSLTNSEDPEDEAELGYGFSEHAVVAIFQFLQDCNADKNFSNEKRDCQEDGNMAHHKHSKSDEILSEGDSIVLEFLECNLANPTIVATDAHKIADVDGKGENFGCEITLQDLLTAPAAVNFCSSLFANYGSKCIIPSLQVQSGPL
ncbi:hypothetical protein O6H91_16G065700 [Diphasiastrum complanatum]|uniref:Uncharacterized protein n=1 Tax=Diphasiastrum complanatum TaxID=34168 RepID=A0ACC2BE08_DIPCM|nr:hypothetical protein O6H91_16G065700 [Diphasiastrum complanatum]